MVCFAFLILSAEKSSQFDSSSSGLIVIVVFLQNL